MPAANTYQQGLIEILLEAARTARLYLTSGDVRRSQQSPEPGAATTRYVVAVLDNAGAAVPNEDGNPPRYNAPVREALTAGGDAALKQCRGCGAAIVWIETEAGKPMPCDPSGKPHWATCPSAEKFRNRKAGKR